VALEFPHNTVIGNGNGFHPTNTIAILMFETENSIYQLQRVGETMRINSRSSGKVAPKSSKSKDGLPPLVADVGKPAGAEDVGIISQHRLVCYELDTLKVRMYFIASIFPLHLIFP
jgi:hypothetical protein